MNYNMNYNWVLNFAKNHHLGPHLPSPIKVNYCETWNKYFILQKNTEVRKLAKGDALTILFLFNYEVGNKMIGTI